MFTGFGFGTALAEEEEEESTAAAAAGAGAGATFAFLIVEKVFGLVCWFGLEKCFEYFKNFFLKLKKKINLKKFKKKN